MIIDNIFYVNDFKHTVMLFKKIGFKLITDSAFYNESRIAFFKMYEDEGLNLVFVEKPRLSQSSSITGGVWEPKLLINYDEFDEQRQNLNYLLEGIIFESFNTQRPDQMSVIDYKDPDGNSIAISKNSFLDECSVKRFQKKSHELELFNCDEFTMGIRMRVRNINQSITFYSAFGFCLKSISHTGGYTNAEMWHQHFYGYKISMVEFNGHLDKYLPLFSPDICLEINPLCIDGFESLRKSLSEAGLFLTTRAIGPGGSVDVQTGEQFLVQINFAA